MYRPFYEFYCAYLIREKTAETTLCKIKLFIAINKKPIIIQTDNRLEFKNKLLENYLKNEGIKHIYSRPIILRLTDVWNVITENYINI